MAQMNITVMEYDRCEERLVLDPKDPEYGTRLYNAGQWFTISHSDMGGENTWLLCPSDRTKFHEWLNHFKEEV